MSGINPDFMNRSLDSCQYNLHQLCNTGLKDLSKLWSEIYGHQEENIERFQELQNSLKKFWEGEIESAEHKKIKLLDSIAKVGKEAFYLETALGLKSTFSTASDIPLADLEERMVILWESYKEIEKKRFSDYSNLQKKERDLCLLLQEEPILDGKFVTMDSASCSKTPQQVKPPSEQDIAVAEQRIQHLERKQEQLNNEFQSLKEDLNQLLEELAITPFTHIERSACFGNEADNEFPCTKKNIQQISNVVERYKSMKLKQSSEADELKETISLLWRKMGKPHVELEQFLDQHKGFKTSTLNKLKETLQELKEERQQNMRELIFKQRDLLDDLWTKCCYTDDQRTQFQPYKVNYYTEDVLDLHELEVERLTLHYSENKKIFQLAERYDDLWKRLLHLEGKAKQSDRLFKNRGGQLLQEEKERKVVQKRLPAMKEELLSLLAEYKLAKGNDFLHFGVPLKETLGNMEEEWLASKEKEKRQRKAAIGDKIQPESRQCARPHTAPTGTKRKLLTTLTNVPRERTPGSRKRQHTPQRHNQHKETPATSTPSNSTSYESFQEHMETVSKGNILNSTKVLVQRTLYNTKSENGPSANTMTKSPIPCKTPKTPTKEPFRIATGSKIPPMGARSVPRKTPRKNLPIII